MSVSPATAPEPVPVPSRVAYFFSGRSPVAALAFERARSLHPQLVWRRHVLLTAADQREFESESHAPDVIISFLNGYVLRPPVLEAVNGNAFNIHPAPPEYPGRDPWHFAYYDGFARAGATLHRMTAKVDEGEILDVSDCAFDTALGVTEYRDLCHELSIALLMKNLDDILAGTIEPRVSRGWRTEAKRSRRDFARMCQIDPTMSPEEVMRRLRSFNTPDHDNVFTVIHGHKFFCKFPSRS